MEPHDLDFLYPVWSHACIWKPDKEGLFVVHISDQHTEAGAAPFHAIHHITLNREGKEAWLLCTGRNTVGSIVETLQKEYPVGSQLIQDDVTSMIQSLSQDGFLVLHETPTVVDLDLEGTAFPWRSDDAIANVVEDNFVIMNMLTSEAFSFERDVETLWNICDGHHAVHDLLSAAASTADVEYLIKFLLKLGLIEMRPAE